LAIWHKPTMSKHQLY